MSKSVDSLDVTPVLPLCERLAQLRPSAELLHFYRDKIAEYDRDREEMVARLERFKSGAEDQHNAQWKLQQQQEEIAALHKVTADLQMCLFQEREQVLKVHAENDRLKIRELEDRQKMQHLLSLSAAPLTSSTTYFVKQPPIKSTVSKRAPTVQQTNRRQEDLLREGEIEKNSLLLSIEALQSQLHDSKKLHLDQVEMLRAEHETRDAEHALQTHSLQERVQYMSDHLARSQSLLYDSTKDFLSLKYENRAAERQWIEEKDHLLRELDKLKEDIDTTCSELTEVGEQALLGLTGRQVVVSTNKNLHTELEQANRLCDMYREQCLTLEEEVCRLKEENDVSKSLFKERTSQMSKRLTTVNSRYGALEGRRTLEMEGFKTDVHMLRKQVHDLEKQLFKVTLAEKENPDIHVLKHVKITAQRSKKLLGEINNVKSKLYSVETNMRRNF